MDILREIIKISFLHNSELDSSGSVTKLTTCVSLTRKFGEIKLHLLFNTFFLLNIIKIQDLFNLKKFLEYPTACYKFDKCRTHSTVAGHVTSV